MRACVRACACASHREQDHGDGERDGHQHGQTHAQEEDVQGVHLAVGVQELRLHAHCGHRGRGAAGGQGSSEQQYTWSRNGDARSWP